MKGKVDPSKIYYGVVHKETLTVIRIFNSTEHARSYIKPLVSTNEYQIERVYLDPYVDQTYNYLLTWLDRPSQRSLKEAFENKKIEKLRIRSPIYIRSTDTVLKDRKLKGYAKELIECSAQKTSDSGSQTTASSSTSDLTTSEIGQTHQATRL